MTVSHFDGINIVFYIILHSETSNTLSSRSFKASFHVSCNRNITCRHNKQHTTYIDAANSWADAYTPWEASETKKQISLLQKNVGNTPVI